MSTSWATTAPSFPDAEIPCSVEQEGFTRNDEGGCVGTKVWEEVGEAVEEHERVAMVPAFVEC